MASKPTNRITHLDTHVVCWLYAGEVARLSSRARQMIESTRIMVSPLVQLEIAYLREIGRLRDDPLDVVGALAGRVGLSVSQTPFSKVVEHALHVDWTRDAFDRLIVAHATADDAFLLTKDNKIRDHFDRARW